jgi:DNA (cytosine-5)-methyltransferase 1
MTRPLLLDLYCGAGGAAMGYHQAGFDIIGVDNQPQPHYPFEFVQADALDVLADGLPVVGDPHCYPDAIHASPPCKRHSAMTNCRPGTAETHDDLLTPTRELLIKTGLPWIIENTPGAPMRPDYILCGCNFNLPRLRRQRWFETSWQGFDLMPPCSHPDPTVTVAGHTGYRKGPGHTRYGRLTDWVAAMGIDWMNRDELAQAIPPAYTEHMGTELMAHIKAGAA